MLIALHADHDEDSGASLLPSDIGQRTSEWLAKKQLGDGCFFGPPWYSAREMMAAASLFSSFPPGGPRGRLRAQDLARDGVRALRGRRPRATRGTRML